jgi:hypothetical protein
MLAALISCVEFSLVPPRNWVYFWTWRGCAPLPPGDGYSIPSTVRLFQVRCLKFSSYRLVSHLFLSQLQSANKYTLYFHHPTICLFTVLYITDSPRNNNYTSYNPCHECLHITPSRAHAHENNSSPGNHVCTETGKIFESKYM